MRRTGLRGIRVKRERRLLLAGLSLLVLSRPALPQELVAIRNPLSREQVQKLIQETELRVDSVLKKEIHLPGLAIALVGRDEVQSRRA